MRNTTRRTRFKPYPELVEPNPGESPFKIIDSHRNSRMKGGTNGMVNLTARRMYVPLNSRGRFVSRHENGHVRWSPLELPETDVPPVVLLAVEDARINLGLARSGVPVFLDAIDRARVVGLGAEDVTGSRWAGAILRCIASIGTTVCASLCEFYSSGPEPFREFPRLPGLVLELVAFVETGLLTAAGDAVVPEFETVVELAREVNLRLERNSLDVPQGMPNCCLAASDSDGPVAGEGDDSSGRLRGRRGDVDGSVTSGQLHFAKPALPHRLPAGAGLKRRNWRPSGEGSVMRYIHRGPIDGRIFRRSSSSRGGTVLIDTSGSMSLDADDLVEIVAAARGAVQVAIYSGRGDEGELRLVARNGLRVAEGDLEPFGKGNIVDLPALEWLARQRGPRIWISDGKVSGIGDRSSEELRDQCDTVCSRSRIRRAAKVKEATDLLSLG
jgi:hypothetical protein